LANAHCVTATQSSKPAGNGCSGASRYSTDTTVAPEQCASSRATLSINPMLPMQNPPPWKYTTIPVGAVSCS